MAAAVCDPAALSPALRAGTVDRPGGLELSVPGRPSAKGTGIVQVPGDPLRKGAAITITGAAAHGAQLLVRTRSGQHVTQSGFNALGLERGGRAVLRVTAVAGKLRLSLRRPDGHTGYWPRR